MVIVPLDAAEIVSVPAVWQLGRGFERRSAALGQSATDPRNASTRRPLRCVRQRGVDMAIVLAGQGPQQTPRRQTKTGQYWANPAA